MPTSDTQVRHVFRQVYGQMVDDTPLPPEWDELSISTLQPTRQKRSLSGVVVAVAAAVAVAVAVGGVAWLARGDSGRPDPGRGVTTGSETTIAVQVPVEWLTVVFRSGELTPAEWEAFVGVVDSYSTATVGESVDQSAAQRQARAHSAGDPDILAVLDEHPYAVTAFTQVGFAIRAETFAFQEEVTGLDFVVAAVGSNGPRLGGGYGDVPELTLDDDNIRAALWSYFYGLNLNDQAVDSGPDPTTTVDVSPQESILYPASPQLLIDEPAVVQEVPGPEPLFDPASLGIETPLRPFDALSFDQLGLEHNEFPLVEGEPIIALGTVDDYLAFRISVHAFDQIHICDWTVAVDEGRPRPLGACAFNEDPRPEVTVTARGRRINIDPADLPEGATGTGPVAVGSPVTQVVWSTLEAQVSVVSLTVDREPIQTWQRPVGGVAVFVVTTQTDDPQFELTAYDRDGNQLRTITAALP